jgi:hypothetical protein
MSAYLISNVRILDGTGRERLQGLGSRVVYGRSLTPFPPARITACMMSPLQAYWLYSCG